MLRSVYKHLRLIPTIDSTVVSHAYVRGEMVPKIATIRKLFVTNRDTPMLATWISIYKHVRIIYTYIYTHTYKQYSSMTNRCSTTLSKWCDSVSLTNLIVNHTGIVAQEFKFNNRKEMQKFSFTFGIKWHKSVVQKVVALW